MHGRSYIGNKWWKIMTIYRKEMNTIRRRVEDAVKENREDRILLGGENRRKRSKKLGRGEGGWDEKKKIEIFCF
jgi:hypothetical protein